MEINSLISEAYRDEQVWLHTVDRKSAVYGSGGKQWAHVINKIIEVHKCATVLDYGCGKGYIAKHLIGAEVRLYDPAIEKFRELPDNSDLVVCLDVLEHIEPEYLDSVLRHLVSLANKFLFISVSLKAAGRFLRDGRNSHLILHDAAWWEKQIRKHGCQLETTFNRLPVTVKEFVGLWKRI